MDNLAHSLVGLTAAKAGLERLSPSATAVCIVAANAPDIDIVSLLFGGRWSFMQNHRGLTHSIAGTFVLGLLIPTFFWIGDHLIASLRNRRPVIGYRGLLAASLIAAATHPLMDWTNNYGIRLMMPWSTKWFYGDLMFIIDPYFWLIVGAAAFLLTSEGISKLIAWSILAMIVSLIVFLASSERSGLVHPNTVRAIWFAAILLIALARRACFGVRFGRGLALGSFAVVLLYWGFLGWAHSRAYAQAISIANQLASEQEERVIQSAAMPMAADPFRWLCVVETNQAMYRFSINLNDNRLVNEAISANGIGLSGVKRYPKPVNSQNELVSVAEHDPRAQIFLGFARFPLARAKDDNCIGQTLVQFADLRYTEPGAQPRGTFSLEVPVECPQK